MDHANRLRAFVLVGLIATAGCGGENNVKAPSSTPPGVQSLVEAIVNGPFIVEPRNFKPFKVVVTPEMANARLEGSFSATGARNDIEVTLLTEAQYANWQERRNFEATYVSGRVTSGKIAVALPATPGTYFVVFSNRFSIFSNKAVTADLQLLFDRRS
jgi:hypothetical protein